MIVNFKSEVARRSNVRQKTLAPYPTHSRQLVSPSLPLLLAPRGLSRTEAAAYIGVSPSLFDEMMKDGRMPSPKKINSRTVWDRKRLDEAFEALPDKDDGNPWDEDEAA
jgi:predicted DNA-binding transcriptional regulator AlpA